MNLPVDALKERVVRNEKQIDDHREMIHKIDKKVDMVNIGVTNLNDTVTTLNNTIQKNSDEGKARHKKSDIMGYISPLIILSGMAALLTAVESGSLQPLIKFLTALSGGQ